MRARTHHDEAAPATVVVDRHLEAEPETVWDYWMDAELFSAWFNPHPGYDVDIHSWDARPGGRLRFVLPGPGKTSREEDVLVQESVPARHLVHQAADGSFTVDVDLEPHEGGTLLRVGLRHVPADVPRQLHPDAVIGWNAALDKLVRHLAGLPPPGRFEWSAQLIEHTTLAPVEEVWAAWTTRDGLHRWLGEAMVEPHVGGRFEVNGYHAVVLEVVPLRRLRLCATFQSPEGPYERHDTVELFPVDDGTQVLFTFTGMHDARADDEARTWWEQALGRL